MKLTAQQALLAAAQVFEDYPERWTTNVYVRNKKGVATNVGSPTAYCFCARGIVMQMEAEDLITQEVSFKMYKRITLTNGNRQIPDLNDDLGREFVIAMFRKAAK